MADFGSMAFTLLLLLLIFDANSVPVAAAEGENAVVLALAIILSGVVLRLASVSWCPACRPHSR